MSEDEQQLLNRIKAKEQLLARGYKWIKCRICKGTGKSHIGFYECFSCRGKGGHWQAPLMRLLLLLFVSASALASDIIDLGVLSERRAVLLRPSTEPDFSHYDIELRWINVVQKLTTTNQLLTIYDIPARGRATLWIRAVCLDGSEGPVRGYVVWVRRDQPAPVIAEMVSTPAPETILNLRNHMNTNGPPPAPRRQSVDHILETRRTFNQVPPPMPPPMEFGPPSLPEPRQRALTPINAMTKFYATDERKRE